MGKLRRLCYQTKEKQYQSFKRYMFRWDNVLSGSVFQLSRIQIDDVELPYTFVGYGISGGNYQSNEPANAMIASTSSFSDPNNKWCMTNISGQYAWFIFDLPQSHHPVSYRLMSGNDTSFQQGRNPQRVRLYGTNEDATDFDDPSWVLLSDEYNYNNSLLATGNREWSNYIDVESGEIIRNYYLLAPSDLDRRAGLRFETADIPLDLDFLYLANEFDGTKIPNKAVNPTFGDYLQAGTLTKNGSGSECYLSNANDNNNYLYVDLTANQVTAIKALAGTTYTWFIRVANTSGEGGIVSTRNQDMNYVYMIRSKGPNLEVHDYTGRDLGSNFTLSSENVFKVRISGSSYYAKNLTTGSEWNQTNSTTKAMGTRLKTFNQGWPGDYAHLAAFYGMAGIPRDTTAEEDELMKNCLLRQSI